MSDAHRERTTDPGKASEAESGGAAAATTDRTEQSLGLEDVRFEEDERSTLPRDARSQAADQPADTRKLGAEAGSGGAITVQVVGRSDVGLVREHNEDNYLLADLATGSREPSKFSEVPHAGLLFAVCDGMGGAAAGEVASQMAVDTVFEMMRRSVPAQDRDSFARALVRSVEEAGTRIFEGARADRTRRGMGTTSTVAALMDKTLFVGQVGDSRAYVLRNTELKQVTKDQSLVNQLIEAGQLTEAEAEAFEHSNIILQALGTTDQVTVDLTFLELRRGDRLMICSDGLSGLVHGDVIRDVMVEYRDLNACSERLIELAKAGGGHDNVTVILCEFGGEGLQLPSGSDLVGYQQYPLPSDDMRGTGGSDSSSPTLSPPSDRTRGSGYDDFGDITGASRSASGTSTRYIMLGLMALGLAFAAYYFMANAQKSSELPKLTSNAVAPVAIAPEPPAHVEVVVRTDVEGGELVVDGESFGTGNEGRWVLDLPPGPHKLDARAGGSTVTTMLVTVREGIPATVLLSMPEGEFAVAEDGGALAAEPKPDPAAEARKRRRAAAAAAAAAAAGDAGVDPRAAARRKRRTSAEEGAAPTPNVPSGTTPAPAPSRTPSAPAPSRTPTVPSGTVP